MVKTGYFASKDQHDLMFCFMDIYDNKDEWGKYSI